MLNTILIKSVPKIQTKFSWCTCLRLYANLQICKNVWAASSILDSMRTWRRHTLNEEKLYTSGARLETSPRKTLTQLAQQLGICAISTWNVTKLPERHPYKKTVIHKLYNIKHEPRVNLVNWRYLHGVSAGETDLTLILFHSEAWFHISGYPNGQNNMYQFAENTVFHKVPLYVKTDVLCVWVQLQLLGQFFFWDPISTSTFTHILTPFLNTCPIMTELTLFSSGRQWKGSHRRQFHTLFRPWVSNLRPVRLYYAAHGHICKLCICYKTYTLI